jgi:uncharacterized membrane protein YbhN (UPF0104 family)
MNIEHSGILKKFFYIIFTIILIGVWFYLIDFNIIRSIIYNVNWFYIFLATILGLIFSLLGSWRLKYLLSLVGEIPFKYVWSISNIGALISLISPFSLGGIMMPYIIAKKLRSSYIKIFPLIVLDAYISLPVGIILSIFAIIYFLKQRRIISSFSFETPIVLIISILVLIFFTGVFMAYLFFKQTIRKTFIQLSQKIKILLDKKSLFKRIILITLMMNIIGALSFYLYFLAFQMNPNIIDFILATNLLGILNIISLTPFKLGQYETAGILTLPYLLHLDINRVFTLLIISRALSLLTIILTGLFAIYLLRFEANVVGKLFRRKKVA